jgi:hypothetical protein
MKYTYKLLIKRVVRNKDQQYKELKFKITCSFLLWGVTVLNFPPAVLQVFLPPGLSVQHGADINLLIPETSQITVYSTRACLWNSSSHPWNKSNYSVQYQSMSLIFIFSSLKHANYSVQYQSMSLIFIFSSLKHANYSVLCSTRYGADIQLLSVLYSVQYQIRRWYLSSHPRNRQITVYTVQYHSMELIFIFSSCNRANHSVTMSWYLSSHP